MLSLHSGCPATAANTLACNDDAATCGVSSIAAIPVLPGNTYIIRVTGLVGGSGNYQMELFGPGSDPFFSLDCNENGTPDECEPDCNGNGIPDDCDLATSTSQDCNSNGVPDECDILSGTSTDCNLNGVPDECEPDCNNNGVADECDVTSVAMYDSGDLSPFDSLNPQQYLIPGAPPAATPVQFEISTIADLGIAAPEDEYVVVAVNAVVVGVLLAPASVDCEFVQGVLTMPAAAYNAALALGGGNANITLTAGPLVDGFCSSYIRVKVTYQVPLVENDCNGNLIPDECEPDCNGTSVPDDCDITSGTSQDCNQNGVPDECDITSGTSQDCQPNGVPDECERDCNNNGVPDECDITSGTSQDCNGTSVPDECELTSDTDCNNNGVLDECEITSETDCNGNQILDECELTAAPTATRTASSTSASITSETDCNGNGVLDECELDRRHGLQRQRHLDECELTTGRLQRQQRPG